MKIQGLPVAPVMVTTDARGGYVAEDLGEDYLYTVEVLKAARAETDEDDAVSPIVAGAREIHDRFFAENAFSAQVEGVRVRAGQTTAGVDLVVEDLSPGRIYGRVTDRRSGAPVWPVVVSAVSTETKAEDPGQLAGLPWFMTAAFAGLGVTDSEGRYELEICNVRETAHFRIKCEYQCEGGAAWPQPEEEVALVELAGGEEKELNFSIDAPVTVPVVYVDPSGAPVEGISAGIGPAGRGGGCGGALVSDASGRVEFHGIPPSVALQALAWRIEEDGGSRTIGVSEAFSGKPGETLRDVVVVCGLYGGIEGQLVLGDGSPVAQRRVLCVARSGDGSRASYQVRTKTDADGFFRFSETFPEGVYSRVWFGCEISDQLYLAECREVAIGRGLVTDVGALEVREVSREEAQALLSGGLSPVAGYLIAAGAGQIQKGQLEVRRAGGTVSSCAIIPRQMRSAVFVGRATKGCAEPMSGTDERMS